MFVGAVPFLERVCDPGIGEINRWRPRPISALNRDLSECYGLPVEFDRKMDGVSAVVRALGRDDVVCAQLATLHLEIPDPPTLAHQRNLPATFSIWRGNCEAAECSRPTGTQRNIHAGRPVVRAASAENSHPPMAWKTVPQKCRARQSTSANYDPGAVRIRRRHPVSFGNYSASSHS